MSSSDYIMAKKAKNIKNFQKPLSNGKYRDFSYEHRYLKADITQIMCHDKQFFKTINITPECNFPPNSEDGRYEVFVTPAPYTASNPVYPKYAPLNTTRLEKPEPCTIAGVKRASIYSSCEAPFHRQWNRKNANILRIKASTTFNM